MSPLESSLWPAAWGMPQPGLPSLSVNPTGLVVSGHLAGLAVSLPETKATPSWSMALAAFSASAHCFSPFTCSMCMLFQEGKMGCSALKTNCVHSSLGIILPAEGPVWMTLALSPTECLLPSLPNLMPRDGGRARGLSSIHSPEPPSTA